MGWISNTSINYFLRSSYPIMNEGGFRVGKRKSREDHRDLYLVVYLFYIFLTWITFITIKFFLNFDSCTEQTCGGGCLLLKGRINEWIFTVPASNVIRIIVIPREITLSADDTWWNNVIKQRNMPPLYRGNLDKPSKSDYSSENSGIRTGTPDIFSDDHDLSRCVTPITVITDDKCVRNFGYFFFVNCFFFMGNLRVVWFMFRALTSTCRFFPDDTTYLSQAREGSKSDSKMLTRRDDK